MFWADCLRNGSPYAIGPLSVSVCPVCNVGVLWPNGWMDQDETWHGGRLGPGHIVLDGNPAPPPQRAQPPFQFSAHVRCGQTAGWIKMPLGMEVGLRGGDIVLNGDPAPPKRGIAPQFSAHVYCGQMLAHLSYC